ncbi:hypothetical protein M427DRAFT_98663 [Gonapodya prolifera JEL478]|uniref:NADAR domain-containing protein n=1 Tax=Gonapodya prolifera (strain JEL478) TaxID=1344416 RepID=A0A139AFL0_GONPJ|nr:hypothetical protein M427DRAFT_98663 [Gonapodya prolifera JEL478]|eukprot:KXS15548.1 hypothetical protein M427DRAFT_98663 [Gonapodya prolifera JEL478]
MHDHNGPITPSCFSQFYPVQFEVDGLVFQTAEHAMMAAKAQFFGDDQSLQSILAASTPGQAKMLGRRVQRFEEKELDAVRYDIVVKNNMSKFSQNDEIAEFLLDTGDAILVEASPSDHQWGVGLGLKNPSVHVPSEWKGKNLLGFALMVVRERLYHQKVKTLPNTIFFYQRHL